MDEDIKGVEFLNAPKFRIVKFFRFLAAIYFTHKFSQKISRE